MLKSFLNWVISEELIVSLVQILICVFYSILYFYSTQSLCESILYFYSTQSLCESQGNVRHQNQFSNRHSIDIARSIPKSLPDSLYAKVEKPFQRDIILAVFWNRQELGQNRVNHTKLWEHQKQNCG